MGMSLMLLLYIYAVPLLLYLAFAVPALYYLRSRDIDETTRAIWALAIIAVPVMGAIAFAFMRPGFRSR